MTRGICAFRKKTRDRREGVLVFFNLRPKVLQSCPVAARAPESGGRWLDPSMGASGPHTEGELLMEPFGMRIVSPALTSASSAPGPPRICKGGTWFSRTGRRETKEALSVGFCAPAQKPGGNCRDQGPARADRGRRP